MTMKDAVKVVNSCWHLIAVISIVSVLQEVWCDQWIFISYIFAISVTRMGTQELCYYAE